MATTFDILVLGTGSGGGTIIQQLALRLPYSRIGAIESGAGLKTADERHAEFLQSITDDITKRTHLYTAEAEVTNYATDPNSPYYGSGYPFATGVSEQGMANVLGGCSMHNGQIWGAASPEDWDQWDYYLRDGASRFYPSGGTVTWDTIASSSSTSAGGTGPALTNLATDGGSIALSAIIEAGAPDGNGLLTKQVWISASDDPKNPLGVPFRVVGITPYNGAGAFEIVVESNPDEGITMAAPAALPLVILTNWNRQRMSRRVYMEVVDSVDGASDVGNPATSITNPNGLDPNLHNVFDNPNDYVPDAVGYRAPYLRHGTVGQRSSQEATAGLTGGTAWVDQRPGVDSPRMSMRSLQALNSLMNSTYSDAAYPLVADGTNAPGSSVWPYLQDSTGVETAIPAARDWVFTVLASPVDLPARVIIGDVNTGARIVLTGVTGAPGANEWQADAGSEALIAASIVAAINTATGGATASAAGAVVTAQRGSSADQLYALEIPTSTVNQIAYNPWGRGVLEPLNCVGTNSEGQPVVGGRGLSRISRFDKNGDRQGTAIVCIEPALAFRIVGITLSAGTVGVGDVITVGSETADVIAATTPAGSVQTLQVAMTTDGEFPVGGSFTAAPSGASGAITSSTPQVTIVSETWASRPIFTPTDEIDMLAGSPSAPIVKDDLVIGSWSQATGKVTKAGTVGALDVAYLTIQVTSGTFLPGEPIEEATAATWTATAAKVWVIQRVAGVVTQPESDRQSGEVNETTYEAPVVIDSLGSFAGPAFWQRGGVGAANRVAGCGAEQIIDLPGMGARGITHGVSVSGIFYWFTPDGRDSVQYPYQVGGEYRSSQNRAGLGWEVGLNNPSEGILFDDNYDIVCQEIDGGQSDYGELDPLFFGSSFVIGLAAKQGWANEQIVNTPGYAGFPTGMRLTLVACLNYKSYSRGAGIFARSMSPFDLPRCFQGLCGQWQARDAEALLEAADQISGRLNDATVAPVGPTPNNNVTVDPFSNGFLPLVFAGPPAGSGLTADRVDTVVTTASAAYHLVGTCGMGPDSFSLSALDERARLRHTRGVYCASNAVYPFITRYNPNGPSMMAAHNIAAMIAEDLAPAP